MSLGYIWWNFWRHENDGGTVTSSWEVGTAPAPTIYAFCSMQSLQTELFTGGGAASPDGYQNITVYSGISSYVKAGLNVPIGNNQKNGVVPGVWDSEVTAVTFSWGTIVPDDVDVPNGFQNINDVASVDFTFQVFGWE